MGSLTDGTKERAAAIVEFCFAPFTSENVVSDVSDEEDGGVGVASLAEESGATECRSLVLRRDVGATTEKALL